MRFALALYCGNDNFLIGRVIRQVETASFFKGAISFWHTHLRTYRKSTNKFPSVNAENVQPFLQVDSSRFLQNHITLLHLLTSKHSSIIRTMWITWRDAINKKWSSVLSKKKCVYINYFSGYQKAAHCRNTRTSHLLQSLSEPCVTWIIIMRFMKLILISPVKAVTSSPWCDLSSAVITLSSCVPWSGLISCCCCSQTFNS